MKCLENMGRLIIPNDLILDMMRLYKFSGRDSYYDTLFKRDIVALKRVTVEAETLNFAKMLDLNLTEARLNLLVSKDLTPKNNDERLVLNLKGVFKLILDNIKEFETKSAEFRNLADLLFKDIYKIKFKQEKLDVKNKFSVDKTIHSYAEDLDKLFNKFNSMEKSKGFEITTLITNLFVDYYMLKPFEEVGSSRINEIMSYIMFYVFLYRYEFDVFTYESFFLRFYENMKIFHQALDAGIFNYDKGYAQTSEIHRIIIKIMLECYESIENKVSSYSFGRENKQSKENEIWLYIQTYPSDTFKKSDIVKQFPHISEKTVERVLAKLQEEKIISAQGTGRSAFWLKNIERKNGFEYERISMDLFGNGE